MAFGLMYCNSDHCLFKSSHPEAVVDVSVVEEPVGQQELQHHNAEVQELAEDEATKIDVVPK